MGKSAIRGNHVARAIASMISGVTKIRNTVAIKNFVHMPGRRARETPAKPPIITAITVAPKAAMNELRIASPTPAKSKMPRYESVSAPLMMKAAKNATGPAQFSERFEIEVFRANTSRATMATATMTMNLTSTAQAAVPSKSSPHHFTPGSPDQIVKEVPPLNECNTTSMIGINKKTMTSAVHVHSAYGRMSNFRSEPLPARERTRERSYMRLFSEIVRDVG